CRSPKRPGCCADTRSCAGHARDRTLARHRGDAKREPQRPSWVLSPSVRCASEMIRREPMVRLVVASCLVLASAFPPTGLTQPRLKGSGVIVGIVVDEHQVPVPRALVQAFLAEDVRKAS